MFYPDWSTHSIETCESGMGWTYDTELVYIDGMLRSIPHIVFIEPDENDMIDLPWDFEDNLCPLDSLSGDGNWSHVGGDLHTSGFLNYFLCYPQGWLLLDGGEEEFLTEPSSRDAKLEMGTGEAWGNVNNADGWTLEFRMFIPHLSTGPVELTTDTYQGQVSDRSPTGYLLLGSPEDYTNNLYAPLHQGNSYSLTFDDGTVAGRMFFTSLNTYFSPNTGESMTEALLLNNLVPIFPAASGYKYNYLPRTIRLSVRGSDVFVTATIGHACDVAFVKQFAVQQASNAAAAPPIGEWRGGGMMPWDLPTAAPPSEYTFGDTYAFQLGGLTTIPTYINEPDPPSTIDPISASFDAPLEPLQGAYTAHLENVSLSESSVKKIRLGAYMDETMPIGEDIPSNPYVIGPDLQGGMSPLLVKYFGLAHDQEKHEGHFNQTFAGESISYTAALQPKVPVESFDGVVVKAIIPASGTCTVEPQYKRTGDGTWNDTSPTSIIADTTDIDLSVLWSPLADLGDQVRFKVTQTPVSGAEPPRIDEFDVYMTRVTGEVDISPPWGPAAGGNIVTLTKVMGTGIFQATDQVYINNVEVPSGDITHISSTIKTIVMPSGTGKGMIKVQATSYWANQPYTYVSRYNLDLGREEMELVFGGGRSAFRVQDYPPDHAINVAMIGCSPVGVDTHLAIVNLAASEPDNLTGFGIREDPLRNGVLQDYEFSDAVDTDEFLISNRAALWKDINNPKPLFYKYLIGRGRFYLRSSTALNSSDLDILRREIRLYHAGDVVEVDYGWDIIASNLDYNGDTLPSHVYSIILLTEKMPETTLWVSYSAVDRVNDFSLLGPRKEVVNPIPLFNEEGTRMIATPSMSSDGSYSVEVTP